MWQSLAEGGKARYKAMTQADKDRYVGELEAYNYRWEGIRLGVTLNARIGIHFELRDAESCSSHSWTFLMWPHCRMNRAQFFRLPQVTAHLAALGVNECWVYPTTLSVPHSCVEQPIFVQRAVVEHSALQLTEILGVIENFIGVLQACGTGSATAGTVGSTAGGSASFPAAARSCSAASPGATWRIQAAAAIGRPWGVPTCSWSLAKLATSAHAPPTAAATAAVRNACKHATGEQCSTPGYTSAD